MSAPAPAAPTVAGLLAEAGRRLAGAGVEQARQEVRWLLARALGVDASWLLAHDREPVPPDAAERFRALVERRAAREPFAYVVGEREFYGRRFLVDRRVLVPRPETELLVDEALRVLRDGRAASTSSRPLVVDVGTGSGTIACTLAAEAPFARVVASDVSADALAVAAENRRRLGLDGRLPLVRGSLLTWLRAPADLVVANLPYLRRPTLDDLMPEVADWEPRLALDGGPDGLELMRSLLLDARRSVRPGGTVLLELDPEQVEPLRAIVPGALTGVLRDDAGLERVLRVDVP